MPNQIVISTLGGPEVLKYQEYSLPKNIKNNEVRIKQTAIGLNYIDTYHRSGIYPLPAELPFCLGMEAAGEVIEIGEDVIHEAISRFYDRAFADLFIGFMFVKFDKQQLIQSQTAFASAMLGGPKLYKGKSLKKAHQKLPLKNPHFDRRQVLMREVLEELELDQKLIDQWMALEESLRPLIISDKGPCSS